MSEIPSAPNKRQTSHSFCPLCRPKSSLRHPRIDTVDRLLAIGVPLKRVARNYGIEKSALLRYSKCALPLALKRVFGSQPAVDSLLQTTELWAVFGSATAFQLNVLFEAANEGDWPGVTLIAAALRDAFAMIASDYSHLKKQNPKGKAVVKRAFQPLIQSVQKGSGVSH